ncbi:MAG: PqqD family protein [Prevotella sp.]|nr:PqqD family protein [Prevotella sp.]
MKIKKGFNLRDICGEQIIVAEGKENIDFSNIISMNETAAFLWQQVIDKTFTEETLVDILTENYEVDRKTAQNDVEELVRQWLNSGIIEP